jgi:hypothetical protein
MRYLIIPRSLNTEFHACSHLLYLVAVPCALTVVLGIIITVYFGDRMPNNLDVESWQNFFVYLRTWAALDQKPQALATLMAVHALQLICCFPFIHMTKTMCGYIFGFWQGLVISFMWENAIVIVYLFTFTHCAPPLDSLRLNSLIAYVQTWRKGRLFLCFLVSVHMASIPFVTKASLVMYSAVTPFEFLISSAFTTLLMSAKDTLFGDYIAHSQYSTTKLLFYSIFLTFSTLIPTVLTLFIIAGISRFTMRQLSIETGDDFDHHNVGDRLENAGDDADVPHMDLEKEPWDSLGSTPRTEIMSASVHSEDIGERDPDDPEPVEIGDVELTTVTVPARPPRRVASVHVPPLRDSPEALV